MAILPALPGGRTASSRARFARLFSAPLALAMAALLAAAPHAGAAELRGRVVDRATLDAEGGEKGLPRVQVTVYQGRKAVGKATTDSKGRYRIRQVTGRVRVAYKGAGLRPAPLTRHYLVRPTDTAEHDAALDRDPREDAAGYYARLARGWEAEVLQASHFREAHDSAFSLGGVYVEGDSSADYRSVALEFLWAEFLSQGRPLVARHRMARALKHRLDSLALEAPPGLAPYLDCDPDALKEYLADLSKAVRDPKHLPAAKDLRKAGVPYALAARLASEALPGGSPNKRKRDRFKARWRKLHGKDLPEAPEGKEEPPAFRPDSLAREIAARRPKSAVAQFLHGRARFASGDYAAAAEALAAANKLRPGVFAAARYLESMALLKLGRDSEALGRLQALREAPSPAWKSRAYYGLGVLNAKEGRNAEAASDLWRAIRLYPEPETVFLLAEVSVNLNDNAQAEKLLEDMAARHPGEHRARYWLGRYAEKREQSGVAEDHFRKAYEAQAAPEYAEALARLAAAREEWGAALRMLEPLKGRLTREGRGRYAECLLHLGRARDAARELAALHATPAGRADVEIMGRYVEALLQDGRGEEALKVAGGYRDPSHPAARLALAKASLRVGDVAKSRLLLEGLVESKPDDPEPHFLLGLGHFQERAYPKAKKEFDLALRYRADHLEAVYYSGLALVRTGRPEDARNFFNELAQRTSPEWRARGFLGVGLSFAAQQKPEAAENYFGRSLAAMETAEAAAHLALSKRRLGGPEHWEADARRAYELDSRHPKAVLAHGEALLARGKKTQALGLFQKAREHAPQACDVLAGLAKSQYLMGQYQASRTTSGSAISQCPGEAEPHYYAAAASDKLRNRKEAEAHFKAYRKAGGDEDLLPADYR